MAEAEPVEMRTQLRTAMFVAATLRVAGRSRAIRIRNMSAAGALIEGDELPAPGSAIELIRGGQSVAGTVAWAGSGRAGLRLGDGVAADEWMARAGSAPSATPKVELAALVIRLREIGERLAADPGTAASHFAELQALDDVRQRLDGLQRFVR